MNSKKRRGKKYHQKKEKRKPKVTKEYLEAEKEVTDLLKDTKIQDEEEIEITSKIEIDFFTNSLPKPIGRARKDKSEKKIKGKSKSRSDTSNEEEDEDEKQIVDSESGVKKDETSTTIEDGSPRAITVHPASSFIQIEDTSPVRKIKNEKVFFSDEDLYYPQSDLKSINLQIFNRSNSFGEDGIHHEDLIIEKNENLIKMVNRYNEEGKYELIHPNTYLLNQCEFTIDKEKLYKTDEVEKEFIPFFYCVPVSEMQREILTFKKLLTIKINEIKFLEHDLQSEEHRLALKLENTFECYQEAFEQNLIEKLNLELQNLRETVTYFLENSQSESENFEKIENYTKKIKFLRTKLHKEEQHYNNLVKNALSQWKTLKNCRKNQGFNYTDFKLLILLEETDPDDDELEWTQSYQIELNEILREEYEFYYKERRLRKSLKKTEASEEELAKHKFPLRKPDIENINLLVEKTFKQCKRPIGEPKIRLFHEKLPDKCKNLDKFKDYYLEIVFDKEFVGATKHFRLNSDFIIDINQSFGVYLESNVPKNIKIQIFEKIKLSPPEKLCKCYIPLQPTLDYTTGQLENIEFSSNKRSLPISGLLKVTIYCETELVPTYDFSKRNNLSQKSNLTRTKSKISKEVIKSWYENNLINPLNPDSMTLFNNLSEKYRENEGTSSSRENMREENEKTASDHFILNEEFLTFCPQSEIDENPRFNMLKSRYYQEMKYKNMKFVPLFENEIEESDDEKVLDEGNWMDSIDLLKYRGRKYLQKVYELIINHCQQLKIDEDNSNLLFGDEPPTWSSIFDTIKGFFGPSRPLNPVKTSQVVSQFQSNQSETFNIIINIGRATGIPVRNFQKPIIPRRSSSISTEPINNQTLKYENVRPYICISYKDKIIRTMTAEGSNPTWNEQLILQINNEKEIYKEDLVIQVFDEYIEDLIHDSNPRSMEFYQKIHTNWLASYNFPIKTILDKQNIDGCFEINLPKLLIGYTKQNIDIKDEDEIYPSIQNPQDSILEIRNSIFIWMYINIEPNFNTQILDKSPLESSELKEVKLHIEEWCLQVKELIPATKFMHPLICTESGKRICMTRLLECIPLPFDSQKYTEEEIEPLVRRFVSLIPILKNETDCLGLHGVWLRNQTILDTTWCSAKDLGVLLACYYMTLGIKCWLALGITYPYGDTSFVLTNQNGIYILTDPSTGKSYETKNIQSPLNKILYIIGKDNIYCNLQKEERVYMTDFNINDSSIWLPLFNKSNPAPIGGFHNLNYKYHSSYSIVELRKNIERKIMKKINNWRTTRKTIWNRAYTKLMNEICSNLEQDIIIERNIQSVNYAERLLSEIRSYRIYGFTLNFPYVNLSKISNMIRSTGIHLNTDKDVEFALSVYIEKYSNNVLSCWIFLMTLSPFE